MRKQTLDFVVAGVFVAFGLYGVYAASQLPMSMGIQIGPGVFPFGATILLALFATVHFGLLILGRRSGRTESESTDADTMDRHALSRQLLVLGALVVAILVFRRVGYMVTMTSLVDLALVTFDERRPLVVFALAAGVAALSYLLFSVALGVRMPFGPVL